MTTEYKALVAEARMFAEARGERRDTAIVSRLADALESASVERAVVEAQALEQAANDLDLVLSMLDSANQNNQIDYGVYSEVHDVIAIALHQIEGARAVEIREGRQ